MTTLNALTYNPLGWTGYIAARPASCSVIWVEKKGERASSMLVTGRAIGE
jgi:hypothetical protein